MLNEIWSVAQSLEKQGIAVKETSKLFKKNKKSPGLRAYLSGSGEILKVEIVDADLVGRLGRYELANGMGFPTFNIKPLRELSKDFLKQTDSRIKDAQKADQPAKAILHIFQSIFAEQANEDARYLKDLDKRLNDIPQDVSDAWGGEDIDADYQGISALIGALCAKKWEGRKFLAKLEEQILSYAASLDSSELGTLYNLCFKSKPPLLLDMEVSLGSIPLVSVEMAEFLNRRLLNWKKGSQPTSNELEIVDSLTGRPGELEDRFPSPSLPILGKVILFSNPKDSACQSRYGLQEGKSFVTTTQTAQSLQDALNFITHQNRIDKSWSSIPGDYGKSPHLVIAYPEQAPDFETGIAALFSSDEQREGVFESQAAAVLTSLKLFAEKHGDPTIKLFVLAKADPGRTQIYLTEVLTKELIEQKSRRWAEASRNVPSVPLFLPPEVKGQGARTIRYSSPGPMAVLNVLNLAFQRDGNPSVRVNNASLRDVFDLFLHDTSRNQSLVRRLLLTTVPQLTPLLINTGAMRTSSRWQDIKPENRKIAISGCTVLGMLLFFLGRMKEQYMSDIAYNLGKLLQCADLIHREYCFEVRNKGKNGEDAKALPRSLVGQSLFNAAMNRPSLALEQLAVRMRVYLQWADNVSKGLRTGPVWRELEQFREIIHAIPREELQRKFTERDRAELFLGYLSDLNEREILEGEVE